MVRPLARGFGIDRRRHAARLRPFLQAGLGIAGVTVHRADPPAPQPQHKSAGGIETAVLIDRRDHRLQRIAQQRLFAPPARQHLGPAQFQHIAQPYPARHIGTGFLADQRVETGGKLAFACVRVGRQQRLGHHQPQHPVPQKLQPLVVRPGGGGEGGMRHRPKQQVWPVKAVAKAALKGLEVRRKPHSTALR